MNFINSSKLLCLWVLQFYCSAFTSLWESWGSVSSDLIDFLTLSWSLLLKGGPKSVSWSITHVEHCRCGERAIITIHSRLWWMASPGSNMWRSPLALQTQVVYRPLFPGNLQRHDTTIDHHRPQVQGANVCLECSACSRTHVWELQWDQIKLKTTVNNNTCDYSYSHNEALTQGFAYN